MPTGEVPERYRDILESTALGHLATIGLDGQPQVNPVWFLADGHSVNLSVKPETAKYRNLRANPAVAMSVGDLVRPDRYVEVRGEVVAFERFETLAWVGSWSGSNSIPGSPRMTSSSSSSTSTSPSWMRTTGAWRSVAWWTSR